tara:strand:+ start:140 stop:283 length:144 start_codon:yes stop_codon:yes gene_type:complete
MKSQKIKDQNYREYYNKYETKRLILKYLLLQKDTENSLVGTSVLSET